ncbi:efflux RND transporter periplasmic adaptor subunit, partial [Neisseria gonorrhoeae]|uniref:efflux RND transporter periplasmic adaptor subunit n=1 Tax=Neisseria gonorrhoeae TaxID=485 RepID=UPI001649C12C
STVWLTAFVRETDTAKVSLGQSISFRVPAAPSSDYRGMIDYIASALDPNSRRLLVRATVDNADGVLKPEMFANVTLYVDSPSNLESIGIPREAVIYEGENAKVSSASIAKWLAEGLESGPAFVGNENGDAKAALASAAKKVEATYNYPYQNHATMEPMNATAEFKGDILHIYSGNQFATRS